MRNGNNMRRGFSLVELVIVIVIIGVIAAIAVPRLSRGAKGARESALRGDLAILRNAIDLYAAEHAGKFPPAGTFTDHMTKYSNLSASETADTVGGGTDSDCIYGPYLKEVPALPIAGVGATAGKIGDTGVSDTAAAGVGWVYDGSTGEITPNAGTAQDDEGRDYTDY